MIPSRLIGGVFAIVLGAFLIGLAFTLSEAVLTVSIYGLIIIGIGVAILLNNSEDKIERIKIRKNIKRKGTKN